VNVAFRYTSNEKPVVAVKEKGEGEESAPYDDHVYRQICLDHSCWGVEGEAGIPVVEYLCLSVFDHPCFCPHRDSEGVAVAATGRGVHDDEEREISTGHGHGVAVGSGCDGYAHAYPWSLLKNRDPSPSPNLNLRSSTNQMMGMSLKMKTPPTSFAVVP
jgi:hypothetical protein